MCSVHPTAARLLQQLLLLIPSLFLMFCVEHDTLFRVHAVHSNTPQRGVLWPSQRVCDDILHELALCLY